MGRDVRGLRAQFGGMYVEYADFYVCIQPEYDDLLCADVFAGDVDFAIYFQIGTVYLVTWFCKKEQMTFDY